MIQPYLPLLGICPKDAFQILAHPCSLSLYAQWLRNGNNLNVIQLVSGWRAKMWYIYTTKYYSAVRKIEIMKFASKQMELEKIIILR